MADTSGTSDRDVPLPPGGGAGERLREFLAAREEPAPGGTPGPGTGTDAAEEDGEDERPPAVTVP